MKREHIKKAYHCPRIQVCQMSIEHLLQEVSQTQTEGGSETPGMGGNNSGSLVPAKENNSWFHWEDETEE